MAKKVSFKAKGAVSLLLVGFILCGISNLFYLASWAGFLGFFSLFSVVGLIFQLIAIVKLQDEYKEFTNILKAVVVALALFLTSAVLDAILRAVASADHPVATALIISFSSVANVIGLVISIYITLNIIKGCVVISGNDSQITSFAPIVIKWYKISVIVNVIGIILGSIFGVLVIIPALADNKAVQVLLIIFNVLNFIVSIASDVAIITLLGKTNAVIDSDN
ncbi:MAG: hypothetical protein MJ208_00015 [Bacilli bacterium]|nr:hypothetical protein [Bacilli bacterium]